MLYHTRESGHTQNSQLNKVIDENEKCVFYFREKSIWTFCPTQHFRALWRPLGRHLHPVLSSLPSLDISSPTPLVNANQIYKYFSIFIYLVNIDIVKIYVSSKI